MHLSITARHFEITKAMKSHIEKECTRILSHFDKVINVHIILTKDNERNNAEIILHVLKKDIQAKSEDENLYKAVDSAIEKIETQLKKIKEKLSSHSKKRAWNNENNVSFNDFSKEEETKENYR